MVQISTIGKIGIVIGIIGGLIGLIVATIADPVFGIIMTFIFGGTFGWVFFSLIKPMFDANNLAKNGVSAQATVLKLSDTGWTMNNDPQIKMLLEVKPLEGPSFQAEIKTFVSRLQTSAFQPGSVLPVKYDPADKTKVAIDTATDSTPEDNSANVQKLTQMLKKQDDENQKILRYGKPAKAKVLTYTDLNIKVNGNNPAVELFLEVHPETGPKFNATAKGIVAEASIPKFQAGKEISVRYDPEDLTKVTIEHS